MDTPNIPASRIRHYSPGVLALFPDFKISQPPRRYPKFNLGLYDAIPLGLSVLELPLVAEAALACVQTLVLTNY